jgi:hypothetical protein
VSTRRRLVVFASIVALALGAGGWFGMQQFVHARSASLTQTDVATRPLTGFPTVDRVVFRSTAPGADYGKVAVVALDAPSGHRAFAPVACDRVDAATDGAVCLVVQRGIVTRFAAQQLDADWSLEREWPLPGVPSRTRLSAGGSLVATTSFVTGHSYTQTGFSTETVIRGRDGAVHGNIEEFRMLLAGEEIAPVDRNLWGVTFVDDTTFYATAQSQSLGRTWLVRGDLAERTLSVVREGVECPSLSPDGTRIAFKKVRTAGQVRTWSIAVLDLATGAELDLPGEGRNVDDQIEWLDDDTLLYGLPRPEEPGVTDVWAIGTSPSAEPRVFIPQAWSPSVVRV